MQTLEHQTTVHDGATPPRRSRGMTAVVLLPGALGLALLLGGCKEEAPAFKPDPVVRAMRVTLEPDVEVRAYTGVVRARYEVDEAFRVGGKLAERRVGVGDLVKAGQVLAMLDPEDLALSVESAEAELRAARSNVAQTGADEGRYRELKTKGHVSEAEYDRRKLAADEARARLERAERSLALARNQRDYAVLVASGPGVVTATHVEAGQVVSQGQRIVTLARLDEKEVLVAIPESRLADLEGSRAEVTLWADGQRPYRARLREVAPQADPATRTYAVRFSLPEADEAVRLGMTATLRLVHGSDRPVAHLPLTAILDQGAGASVFVVDPQTRGLKLKPVSIERYGETQVAIGSGLGDGELVVTLGVQKLDEGLKVRTAEASRAELR
jgi:RND family efflux transporter MFP subunit